MAVPKKKVSKSKRNTRRAHDGINKAFISFDSVTGEAKLSHHLSLKDGYYNGKKLVGSKITTKEQVKEKSKNKQLSTTKG